VLSVPPSLITDRTSCVVVLCERTGAVELASRPVAF
jgi:hypothetical protein